MIIDFTNRSQSVEILLLAGTILLLPILFIILLGKTLICKTFDHIYPSDSIRIGNIDNCIICEKTQFFKKEEWYRGQHFRGAIPQRQRCTSK